MLTAKNSRTRRAVVGSGENKAGRAMPFFRWIPAPVEMTSGCRFTFGAKICGFVGVPAGQIPWKPGLLSISAIRPRSRPQIREHRDSSGSRGSIARRSACLRRSKHRHSRGLSDPNRHFLLRCVCQASRKLATRRACPVSFWATRSNRSRAFQASCWPFVVRSNFPPTA
jgi:hypothetical protein